MQPVAVSHAAAGQRTSPSHAMLPLHSTSHSHASSQRTPRSQLMLPLHSTSHGPLPQRTRSAQLLLPAHRTRHGPVDGQVTPSLQLLLALQSMTQTPAWQVPAQSGAQPGGGGAASGVVGGTDASGIGGGVEASGPGGGGTAASVITVASGRGDELSPAGASTSVPPMTPAH